MKELVKREDTHNPTKKKKTRAIKSNNHESITYNVLLLTYYTLHSRRDERPQEAQRFIGWCAINEFIDIRVRVRSFVRSMKLHTSIYRYIHIHTYHA